MTQTLDEAREFVRARLADGVTCPCCDQLCQAYVRKLNRPMMQALLWLVRTYWDREWAHIDEFPVIQGRPGGGDFAKLAHWGLIRQRTNEDPSKRTSGYWKATKLAVRFVLGDISLPAHAVIYNNEVTAWSNEEVDITQLVDLNDFHYQRMMEETRLMNEQIHHLRQRALKLGMAHKNALLSSKGDLAVFIWDKEHEED